MADRGVARRALGRTPRDHGGGRLPPAAATGGPVRLDQPARGELWNLLDRQPYGAVQLWRRPAAVIRKGAEEARNQLPRLLEAAEDGRSTVITKRGRPVAVLVPIRDYAAPIRQEPLTSLAGSGRALWGRNSARTVRELRDEWSR